MIERGYSNERASERVPWHAGAEVKWLRRRGRGARGRKSPSVVGRFFSPARLPNPCSDPQKPKKTAASAVAVDAAGAARGRARRSRWGQGRPLVSFTLARPHATVLNWVEGKRKKRRKQNWGTHAHSCSVRSLVGFFSERLAADDRRRAGVAAVTAYYRLVNGGVNGDWTDAPNEWTSDWTIGPNEWMTLTTDRV